MIDIFHLKHHICYIFRMLGKIGNQLLSFKWTWPQSGISGMSGKSSKCLLQGDQSLDGLFSTPAPTYVTFLESLGQKEINYCYLSEVDNNLDDQKCQECPPSIFFKETGVLMYIFHWSPHICYIFRIIGTQLDQTWLFQSP